MSRYPSRAEAMEILRQAGCPEAVIRHSLSVADIAIRMVDAAGLKDVDRDLIEIGGMLHDLGRCHTNGVKHGVLGARMARKLGLDEAIVMMIERHVGAGIPAEEARELGLPARDFQPLTYEEKIVCYADKLAARSRQMSYSEAREQMVRQLGSWHPAIKRLERLHEEMRALGINHGGHRLIRESTLVKKKRGSGRTQG